MNIYKLVKGLKKEVSKLKKEGNYLICYMDKLNCNIIADLSNDYSTLLGKFGKGEYVIAHSTSGEIISFFQI